MNAKTTLRLLVLVLLLGGGILLSEYHRAQRQQLPPRRTHVIDIPDFQAHTLVLTCGETNIVCGHQNNGWMLTRPVRWRADPAVVERCLAALETMTIAGSVSVEECRLRGLQRADYGLAPSRLSVQLQTIAQDIEIAFGIRAPLSQNVYVTLAGDPTIYATPAAVLDDIPVDLSGLRERKVFHEHPDRVVRVELRSRSAGFTRLIRTATGWQLEQPVSTPADQRQVQQLLEALFAISIARFHWDPLGNGADNTVESMTKAEACGLTEDRAQARISIWTHGDEIGQELVFGDTLAEAVPLVYARTAEFGSIFLLPADIRPLFDLQADDLRDRHLLAHEVPAPECLQIGTAAQRLTFRHGPELGWSIEDPADGRADQARVNEWLALFSGLEAERFSGTNATSLAEDQPGAMTVTFSRCTPAGSNLVQTFRVLLGAGTTQAWAHVAGRPEIMTLPVEPVRHLFQQATNPIVFRDRTIVSILPDAIRDLTVTVSGVVQRVQRDATGAWVAEEKNTLNAAAVDDILFLVANLRAERIAAVNPESLEPFGLHQHTRVLSIGLQETAGIRKHILIGNPTPDGRFLAVQGVGAVFVVPDRTANRLTPALWSPPPGSP